MESEGENYDESELVFQMDNGKFFDFEGEKLVTYAEVSSGRDKFTACTRKGCAPDYKIETNRLLFQNRNRN